MARKLITSPTKGKPPIKYLYKLTSGANLVKFLQVGDIFLYFTMVGKEVIPR